MASHRNYVKKRIAIDTVTWTDVIAPVDCMVVGIKNAAPADMKIRTDPADPNTEDVLSAGFSEFPIVANPMDRVQTDRAACRFLAGERVCSLQAVSGTGPALVTFTR